MTEYGRGEGSEPWNPEDPLYGDGGWEGQQAHAGQQSPYGGQPQHYPQQPQQYDNGGWDEGRQAAYGQAQQQYPQHDGQYDQQQYNHQYDQQQYGQQQYDQQAYQDQQQQSYDNNGWASGTQGQIPYPADPSDPYGQQAAAYGAEQQDYYGSPDAYPPPEPPSRRRAEPEPQTDWDPGPDQGEHAFFAGGDDDQGEPDDSDDPQGGRGDRRGRGGKGSKKRKSGCACLVVLLVFGGGTAGVGYFGYQFYKNRFGTAPDYAGGGTSQMVTVQVPKGAGGYAIGRLLKDAGVVKSVDAFVSAQEQNAKGNSIQAGAYLLKKEMSAESAVAMMLDPKSQNNVLVAPGVRNAAVYKRIDEKLDLASGTTRKIAEQKYKSLGLPSWANDNREIKDPLEGFLYPGTYPAAKGMKPESVLKEMVTQAAEKYAAYDLEAKAKALKLDSPLQVITVASLVQAEGKTEDDYRKMAEVVYNRLNLANPETYGFLQFDSTFNYVKNESNIEISEKEINSNKDPYNTYTNKGLPPGPIDNPGDTAMKATLDPTDDGWYYFVATDGVKKTEFAKTHAEFLRLKEKFNASTGS
ncbi:MULTISPECIES: endolytic transglycosylase MltG [Streptomyces]|uniref:Endolytic murein transglycosylase n=1 Tax=Streptomyces sviceus (strain ATCC 29083 / DSM 924 / JCM 4929 / NBRC 13980 / NCIMB 11184 / NRRL 5439 / UC 5370) TaxID=463191 RepID=B5I016_STRX2|nr:MULTISPECIES: endolytic transglycosylase MltG [Streptomyces]EDY58422.2 integral membrane protein [Streptomyces sviceus ATCC 29083]MYT04549.1 endolytic transglycosylase MltG [Streptomyces sp. SID5470]